MLLQVLCISTNLQCMISLYTSLLLNWDGMNESLVQDVLWLFHLFPVGISGGRPLQAASCLKNMVMQCYGAGLYQDRCIVGHFM